MLSRSWQGPWTQLPEGQGQRWGLWGLCSRCCPRGASGSQMSSAPTIPFCSKAQEADPSPPEEELLVWALRQAPE